MVGATLNALAASGLFTQDEDVPRPPAEEAPPARARTNGNAEPATPPRATATAETPRNAAPPAEDKPLAPTQDDLARIAGWTDLAHAERTREECRRLLGLRVEAGELIREQANAAWHDYGAAPTFARAGQWAEQYLVAQVPAPAPKAAQATAEPSQNDDGEDPGRPFDDDSPAKVCWVVNCGAPEAVGTPGYCAEHAYAAEEDKAIAKGKVLAVEPVEDPLAAGPGKTPPGQEASFAGDKALAEFDKAIGYTPPATPLGSPEARRARAIHFHRRAGALKISKEDQEAIIMVASGGLSTHAGEISFEDQNLADSILDQLDKGEATIEPIRRTAEQMKSTPGHLPTSTPGA
jgi:hypothetical protein